MKYRYLLFDLDGTLLPMEKDEFIDAYIKALADRMKYYLEPQKFIKALLSATQAMIYDRTPERTNEEVFMTEFFSLTKLSPEEILPVFDEFYRQYYPSLISYTRPTPLAGQILRRAADYGYELVIATNPVFPCIAIKERLRWSGAGDINFRYITAYEEMHFCKPWLEYFEEILKILNASPEECLMIGNDVEEDMVASQIGIDTYLVEDCLVNHSPKQVQVSYRGCLKDLLKFLE